MLGGCCSAAHGPLAFLHLFATTLSVRPALLHISITAAPSKTLRPWPPTRVLAPPSSMTARTTRSRLTRSRKLEFRLWDYPGGHGGKGDVPQPPGWPEPGRKP